MGSPEQFYRNPDHDRRATPEQRAFAIEQERKRQAAEAAQRAKEARDALENEMYDSFKEASDDLDEDEGKLTQS